MSWQSRWQRRPTDQANGPLRHRIRRAPRVEALEGRSLLTTAFGSPVALSGASVDIVKGITDGDGSTDVVGTFRGSVNFAPDGSSAAGTAILKSGATANMFVARYDPAEKLVWVRSFADNEAHGGTQVTPADFAVDPDTGRIVVVGSFKGRAMDFDPGAGSDILTPTARSTDGFVIELDNTGALVPGMARSLGTTGTNQALTVSTPETETFGDAPLFYIGGSFQGSPDFNPGGTGGTLTGPKAGSRNTSGFLLKLSTDFDFQWVRGGAGSGFTRVTGVTVTDHINPVAVGTAAGRSAQVELLDRAGTPTAQVRFAVGGIDPASALHVTSDLDQNIYVAGQVAGAAINFNPQAGGTPVPLTTARKSADVFLAKFDAALLGVTWVRQFASAGADVATGLDFNEPADIIHLGGTEVGQATFGTAGATNPVVLAAPGKGESAQRGFAIQVKEDGSYVQGFATGGRGPSRIANVTYNPSVGLTVAGDFAGRQPRIGTTPLAATGAAGGFFDVTTSDTGPLYG